MWAIAVLPESNIIGFSVIFYATNMSIYKIRDFYQDILPTLYKIAS